VFGLSSQDPGRRPRIPGAAGASLARFLMFRARGRDEKRQNVPKVQEKRESVSGYREAGGQNYESCSLTRGSGFPKIGRNRTQKSYGLDVQLDKSGTDPPSFRAYFPQGIGSHNAAHCISWLSLKLLARFRTGMRADLHRGSLNKIPPPFTE